VKKDPQIAARVKEILYLIKKKPLMVNLLSFVFHHMVQFNAWYELITKEELHQIPWR
jgi:hypothetical protein